MTQLFVQIKQIGKRKPVIEKQAIEIPETVQTLRQLLVRIVRERVENFNQKNETGNWTKYLTNHNRSNHDNPNTEPNTEIDLEIVAETGKVGFDAKYNDKEQDPDKAVEAVLLAFEDGLFRVFCGDNELIDLDGMTTFNNGNTLTFIRLTMLAGRSW
ncbi:MAG: hypothetical protein LBF88_08400 [Planctomycetaceae bacterium]|jgi:hypothetical protein|nr:hypothetical protein [Planctomycetaceae bacterium]